MKTISQFIREHLLETMGYVEKKEKLPDLEELRRTEWSEEFDILRKNRMIMGAFRYNRLSHPDKFKYDLLGGLRKKLEEYEKTGNTECLVDAANYLMLEFMKPSHKNAHFAAHDDKIHCPVK